MGKSVGASICSCCNEKDQLFTFGSLLVLLRRLENVYAPLTFTLIISIRSARLRVLRLQRKGLINPAFYDFFFICKEIMRDFIFTKMLPKKFILTELFGNSELGGNCLGNP